MRAILIDDEVHAIENLTILLNDFCEGVNIVASTTSALEGIKLIKQKKPDIVFLDVSMPHGSGFDVLDAIGTINFKVVFVTAYEQYAIEAIRRNAFDYIMKPIQIKELRNCTSKLSEELKNSENPHMRISLHSNEYIDFIEVSDIIYCKSDNVYCDIYTNTKGKLTYTKKMKDLEAELPNHTFIRCHNSHIVNKNFVFRYSKTDGGALILKNESIIPVSRSKKEDVVNWLES